MTTLIIDPVSFFHALGGLHDAGIDQIRWDVTARTMTIGVDDLNANFEGLAEYGGQRQAFITFTEIEDVSLQCDARADDVQRIYRLEVTEENGAKKYRVLMRIGPSGRLCLDCRSVSIFG